MGYVLDRGDGGDRAGVTIIEARGVEHRIEFRVDHVNNQPKIVHTTAPSPVEVGTKFTIHWPAPNAARTRGGPVQAARSGLRLVQSAPHACAGSGSATSSSTRRRPIPNWEKWRPRNPTSPHWYDEARLQRYLAAHVARDRDLGQRRTVREFIAEFRGLSGTAVQRKILTEVGCSHQSLASFFGADRVNRDGIAKLLAAMKRYSKPVAPKHLGVIGVEHFKQRFLAAGGTVDTFKYQCRKGMTDDGIPYVVEFAFGLHQAGLGRTAASPASCASRRPRRRRRPGRVFVTGANWSAAIAIRSAASDRPAKGWRARWRRCAPTPISRSSARFTWPRRASSSPTAARVRSSSPTTRSSPMTKPRPRNIANDILDCVETATAKWTRQKKSEERHPGNIRYRMSRMTREPRTTQKEAAWEVMEAAYMAASGGGTLPAKARQIYYQARPKIMAMTDDKELQYGYFSPDLAARLHRRARRRLERRL